MNRFIWNITKRLLAIVPIVVLFLFMYKQLVVLERNNVREKVISEHTGHLQLMDFFVTENFAEYYSMLHLIRNSNSVANFLADPSDENREGMKAFFKRMAQNRPYINGLLLGTTEGEPLVGLTSFDGSMEYVGLMVPFEPIWDLLVSKVKNLEEDGFYFSPLNYVIPLAGEEPLHPVIGTSIPIYCDGEQVGILGMLVNGNHILAKITQFIQEHPNEIKFSLVDNYGNRILRDTVEGITPYNPLIPNLSQSKPLLWEKVVKEGKGLTVIDGYNYYFHAFNPFKEQNPFYEAQPHFLAGIVFFADQDTSILSDSFLLRHKSLRWVLALFIFVVGGFLNILSYFRRNDRELLAVSNLISDQSHDGVVISDALGHVTYCNHTFQSMTGFSEKEISEGRHRVVDLSGVTFNSVKAITSSKQRDARNNAWQGFLWLEGKHHLALTHLRINSIVDRLDRILYQVGLYSNPRNLSRESFGKMIIANEGDAIAIDQYPLQLLAQKCEEPVDHPFVVIYLKLVNIDIIEAQYTLDEHYLLGAQIRERIANALKNDDLIIQLSPDTFLLTASTDKFSERKGLGHIEKAFEMPVKLRDQLQIIRIQCGISSSSADCSNVSLLLRQARMALAAQDHFGHSGSLFYDETVNEYLVRYYEILESFPTALEKGEITVYFQPIVATQTNTIIGAEALARWEHPKLGAIPPNEFIPIIEQNNLERLLGRFVVEHAVLLLHELSTIKENQLVVSMNLSPTELEDPDLVPHMVRTLDAYNVSHELLIIELTEHSLLTDIEIAKKQLIELHQEHVSFAIDDFGTGFSSLSYLHELNFDILKIDRSFIKDYPKNDEGVILKAMIRMVKELGIAVVMEGVELPEQLVLLKELKVPYYQGFIFSKAVPKDQFLEMLQG